MKTRRNFTIVLTAIVVLTAVLTIAAIGTAGWDRPGPDYKECGLIGTWYGHAYGSLEWLGIQTAGSKDDRNGEMLLNWVSVSSDLLDVIPGYPASRMTSGHGVWEQSGRGKYRYTWYAYGIDDTTGDIVFSVRVKGLATNTDCNNVAIDFTYDVFDGLVSPQGMSGASPFTTIQSEPGKSGETRVPLVTP